jgi:hypothetical protein
MPISVIQRTRAIRFLPSSEISVFGSAPNGDASLPIAEGYYNAGRNSRLATFFMVEEFPAVASPRDNIPAIQAFAEPIKALIIRQLGGPSKEADLSCCRSLQPGFE